MLHLSAFADEAGKTLEQQIAAMKRNNIPYLELRSIDGKNVAAFTEDEAKAYAEQLAAAGVPAGLIRISCGLESKEDLIADINQALEAID